MSRAANRYRPEVQARLIADASNPEVQRRKAMYRKARGEKKREIVHWNIAWNLAGRPANFPDFPEWRAAQRAAADARNDR